MESEAKYKPVLKIGGNLLTYFLMKREFSILIFSGRLIFDLKRGGSYEHCVLQNKSTLMLFFWSMKRRLLCTHSVPLCYMHSEYVIQIGHAGFYPSTFVYSRFLPMIQFLYCLLSSVAPRGGPMVDSGGKIFEI